MNSDAEPSFHRRIHPNSGFTSEAVGVEVAVSVWLWVAEGERVFVGSDVNEGIPVGVAV